MELMFLCYNLQLNLVCDDGWWPSTSTTFFYVGSLFGNVVFGWIADKYVQPSCSSSACTLDCRQVELLYLATLWPRMFFQAAVFLIFTEERHSSNLCGNMTIMTSFKGFFNPSRKIRGKNLKLVHNNFLPHPFWFILSSFNHSVPHSLSYWQRL